MSKQDAYELVLRPMSAVFSPPSHIAKADEATALEEYADALKGFDPRDLATAWRNVRNGQSKAWWPPIGALTRACHDSRKERIGSQERVNGRVVDGQFQPWGGACRCENCVNRIPTPGFYRAPADLAEKWDRARTAALEDFQYRREQLPHVRPGESMAAWRMRCNLKGGNFDADAAA